MMLKDQIEADIIVAMKAKDKVRTEVLKFIKASIQRYEVDNKAKGKIADDKQVVQILKKQAEQVEQVKQLYENAGKVVEANQEAEKLSIIVSYIPVTIPISDDDLRVFVKNTIAKINELGGKSNIGIVIKNTKEDVLQHDKRIEIDGATLTRIIQEELSN